MNQEIISVIVPVYNVEKYLEHSVNSIINQTYKKLEIILVDDGSTDQSGQICDEIAKKDSRIVVYHKENGGLSDARNYGLDRAVGQYIAFVDSDDYIATDMYEKLYEALKKNDADYAICNLVQVDEKGKELNDIKKPVRMTNCNISGYEILKKIEKIHETWSYIPVWTKLYKAELFKSVRFPKGKINEDEFVFNQLLSSEIKATAVSIDGYFYRRTANTITTQKFSLRNLNLIEAYFERMIVCEGIHYTENMKSLEEASYRLLRKSYQEFSEEELNSVGFVTIEEMYKKILRICLRECKTELSYNYKMKKKVYLMFPKQYIKHAFGKKIVRL